MKARVNTFLNIRTGTPEILPDNNPNDAFFKPGDVIEIVEVVKGDTYKENNVWYKLDDGTFVWSGGVDDTGLTLGEVKNKTVLSQQPSAKLLQFEPNKMSWAHQYLEIPFIWDDIKTAGKDVVVGIVDTGIDVNNDDLKFSFLNTSTHIDNNGAIDTSPNILSKIQDTDGHGTQMAGIIAAKGKNVYGIAPESSLLVIKLDSGVGRTTISIAESINFLVSQNVDLISISQTCFDDKVLQDAILSALNSNIPVFAAIGNFHTSARKIDKDSFPACNTGSTAVGAFDENKNVCNFSQRNEHLAFLAPGSKNTILTTTLNSNTPAKCEGQTSIATAIAAACFALIVSFLKIKNRIDLKNQALEILKTSCDDMGEIIGHDADNGFGRINLRQAISQVKNLL